MVLLVSIFRLHFLSPLLANKKFAYYVTLFQRSQNIIVGTFCATVNLVQILRIESGLDWTGDRIITRKPMVAENGRSSKRPTK